jgi:hypothetical protein
MRVYMDSEVILIEDEHGALNSQRNYWEERPSTSWNTLEPLSVRGWTLWKDKWDQKQAYCLKATMPLLRRGATNQTLNRYKDQHT